MRADDSKIARAMGASCSGGVFSPRIVRKSHTCHLRDLISSLLFMEILRVFSMGSLYGLSVGVG